MRIYEYTTKMKQSSFARKLKKRFPWLTRKFTLTWLFRLTTAGVLAIALLFMYYSASLPDPNKLLERSVAESTKIFDRDGGLLYEVHGEFKRTLIPLDQIPKTAQQAAIAVEDKDFYKHGGISLTGIARSVIIDVLTGSKSQGGSTITQQFVKNAVLSKEKRFSRKLKEIILSLEIEARFSKDDILKLYLNEIPYGRNAYGIQAASQTYFNKNAPELTLAESAYLAALPQAPTYYNPFGPNREALEDRQKHILNLMKEQGYITQQQQDDALQEKIVFQAPKDKITAPHFVFYVQDYLAKKYGEKAIQEGGLKVYTTLDPRLQEIGERVVREGAQKALSKNAHNAGLVAIDPKTGQILAMVGSKDYFADSEPVGCISGKTCTFEPQVNVATAQRQPGSSFKPYAYVTAFSKEHGYSPASPLFDVVTNFGNYTPRNFSGGQIGPVTMRKALAGSLNIPAVKTLALVGVENVTETAHNLGITTPLADCGLSLVLGGCEVRLVDHVAAYSVLANGGAKNEKTPIMKVIDNQGKTLEEYQQNEQRVLDPQAVYLLTSIMSDNQARSYVFGGNSPLTISGRPVAAKTGTTNDFKDGWTLGFTPSLAAGVWTGNNNGQSLKADAVVVAGPIWNAFMREALKDKEVEKFEAPDGISRIAVDTLSGKLPTEYSGEVREDVFASWAIPNQKDDIHVGVRMDSQTGQPATENTLPENIIINIFTNIHSERPDNPAWENPVRAWALANGYIYPPDGSSINDPNPAPGGAGSIDIISPQENSIITQLPMTINISVSNADTVSRIDIFIDGEPIQSLTKAPYSIQVNKKYSNGPHTITARLLDNFGKTSETSTQINFALDQSLNLTSPAVGETISFPLNLQAESSGELSSVSFYYQSGVVVRNLGLATQQIIDGVYIYTYTWQTKPKSGQYKVYARAENGPTSQKITISVN
jgi:1A family penicillin-binding protein